MTAWFDNPVTDRLRNGDIEMPTNTVPDRRRTSTSSGAAMQPLYPYVTVELKCTLWRCQIRCSLRGLEPCWTVTTASGPR